MRANTVVWTVPVVTTAVDGEEWGVPAERVRFASPPRFASFDRGRDARVGRLAALRASAALTIRTGCSPHQPLARPRLSLSHRDGRAVAAAVPEGFRVGIDLEREDAVDPSEVGYFLTERERAVLGRHDATRLWVLKEAAWKLLTLTPATPFHALELQFGDDGRVERVACGDVEVDVRAEVARPWPGYLAGVVWSRRAA